jgi:hypothetical protein
MLSFDIPERTAIMVETTTWGTIGDHTITFPMSVPEFNAATMMFTVDAAAARALLPGTAFEIVETAPGSAQLILAAVDYRRNPWGTYNEINLGFLVQLAGASTDTVGSFIYRMPVDQAFTCEAGNRVMGFPKTVEVIKARYGSEEVEFSLTFGGQPTLTLRIPRVPAQDERTSVSNISYSYLAGQPHSTELEMQMGDVVDVSTPNAVDIELGSGIVADELRSLGLPTTPDLCMWGENLAATFHAPRPV